MNQDTINGIRAYAGLYNDLRAISSDCHYYLTPDRLKGLDAEFEGLNGIVEAVGSDPDKEGIKRMLWGFAGADWPGLLSLSGKAVEKWVNGMLTQTTKPREEIVERVEAFKVLLGKINNQTQRIAGVLGLKYPIDQKEARAIFKEEVIKGGKWKRILAVLDDFKNSNPSKREVALWAFYIWGIHSKERNKEQERVVNYTTFTAFHRDFAKLLGVEAGQYKHNYLGKYVEANKDDYLKTTMQLIGKL